MVSIFSAVIRDKLGNKVRYAITGVVFGLILLLASALGLFWNEGRAVARRKALAEGLEQVVSVTPGQPEEMKTGRLIHLTGLASPSQAIVDNEFGVKVFACRLSRHVQMYQWVESSSHGRNRANRGEKSSKYYRQKWLSKLRDSKHFREAEAHANPEKMPVKNWSATANKLYIGKFELDESLISRIGKLRPIPIDHLRFIRSTDGLHVGKTYLTIGKDPENAEIGDIRIQYFYVPVQEISVIARQEGLHLGSSQTSDDISLVQTGHHSAEEMFGRANSANTMLTWFIRLGGCFLMTVAFFLTLRPIASLAKVVPLLGDIAKTGLWLISCLLALGTTLVTISCAWIFYRPILAIGLLLVSLGILAFLAKSDSPGKDSLPPLPE